MKRNLKKGLALLLAFMMSVSALNCLAMADESDGEDGNEDSITVPLYITCEADDLRPNEMVDVMYTIGPVEGLKGFEIEVSVPDDVLFEKLVRKNSSVEYLMDLLFNGDGEVTYSGTSVKGYAYYNESYTSEDNTYMFSARYCVSPVAKDGDEVTFGVEECTLNLAGYNKEVEIEVITEPVAVVAVDSSALKRLITRAEALIAAGSLYDADDIAALEEAVKAAQEVLDKSDVSQEDIDKAYETLSTAYNKVAGTDEESSATLADLEEAVTVAKELNEADYTAESWEALQTALKAAEEVLENEEATQEDIDNAASSLRAAVEALKPADESGTTEITRDDLEEAIKTVQEQLNESNWTAESWAALQEALEAAQAVLDDENATQEDIENAYNNLMQAVDNLVAKSDSDSSSSGSGSGSGSVNGGTGTGTTVTSPQTGDNIAFIMCMVVFTVCIGACGVLFAGKARTHKNK